MTPPKAPDAVPEGVTMLVREAFRSHGAAVRRRDDAPIPGEPFISIETAVGIAADLIQSLSSSLAVADAARTRYFHEAADAQEELAKERERVRELSEGLERIESWEMPETGEFWQNADGSISDRPMSYGACYGSNGERDVIRAIARDLLSQGTGK